MALNLSDINLAALKPEITGALDILIKALQVTEDLSVLLPAGTGTVLGEAVKVLTAFETVLNKL